MEAIRDPEEVCSDRVHEVAAKSRAHHRRLQRRMKYISSSRLRAITDADLDLADPATSG